jgi:hypothetical protein
MTTPNTHRLMILAAAGLLGAAALGLVWFLLPGSPPAAPEARTPPPDPRLEYAGPFRNVHPSVRYVPDSRCTGCHRTIAAAYAEHPMGRSLWPVAQAPAPPTGEPQNNPFQAFGTRFLVEYTGGGIRHRRTRLDPAGRTVAEQAWDVGYVIGSGTRGYSYLTDHDGYLFQTPISWYSQKKKPWDLSPGFDASLLTGRVIVPGCLFCHANRANHVEGSVNRYTRPVFDGHAIGCQRCHGPGELHIGAGAGKDAAGMDPTIVNPKHLAADLRQAVCEQCHLQGAVRVLGRGRGLYDFRPGLPAEKFWSVFVRGPGKGTGRQAVGQVEQMYESRCYQGGADPGRLWCASCHDPHERVPPARRVAYYRERCLQCHQQRGCSRPVAERLRRTPQDSCIDCHMPRYGAADIPHTAVTDHRILRDGESAPRKEVRPPPGDGLPVASFYVGRKGVDEEEEQRRRGVALVNLALMGDVAAARAVGHVLPALEAACRRDPDDFPAGEACGYALSLGNQDTEALAAFQAILARAPDRELALVGAATAAETLGQRAAALSYFRRAVAANPWVPAYRRSVVLLLVKQEEWNAARAECEAWLRIEPLSAEARAVRVSCLLATGDKAEARAEFARVEALAPPNLGELRIRFERKLR